jgi:hypothetical protein
MRYEVEQAGAGDEHEPDVGTHAEPERWHVVNVFNADAVPMPLRFDTLEQALAYVVRMPGTLRVVDDDEGERMPVDSGRDGYASSRPPGPITFKRGLDRFRAIAAGWRLRDVCMP